MRFHCSNCSRDFTTLSQDKDKKLAFSYFVIDDMQCPHCGASNHSHPPKKPLRKTRSRWQPKRRSRDTDEFIQPIVLSSMCQSRLCGSLSSKLMVVCDGCPSAFNCLTGNIDDGVDLANDKEVKVKEKAKQVEEAKVQVVEKEKKDAEIHFKKLKEELGNCGFSYEVKNGVWSARFRGTVWKLDNDDIMAIIGQTWHTPKTIIIKNTLVNRGLKPVLAQELLNGKYI